LSTGSGGGCSPTAGSAAATSERRRCQPGAYWYNALSSPTLPAEAQATEFHPTARAF
jgi:hypothetical protein